MYDRQSTRFVSAMCITYFVVFSLLKYTTIDSTLAESVDPSQAPEKDLLDKEKATLKKLLPLVEKFVHEKSHLQVSRFTCFSLPSPLICFHPSQPHFVIPSFQVQLNRDNSNLQEKSKKVRVIGGKISKKITLRGIEKGSS